jgi:hypothetical protein
VRQKGQRTVAESLREFLDRRERELLVELAPAENQLLAIRAELIEIRRAKASLEESAKKLAEALRGSSVVDPAPGALDTLTPFGIGGLLGVPLPLRQATLDERLSIKQMILKVLEQEVKFRRYGATASEIRESIKDEFGREIEGTSLSPQLSRLREDGLVDVHENRWKRTDQREKGNSLYPKALAEGK